MNIINVIITMISSSTSGNVAARGDYNKYKHRDFETDCSASD